MMVETENESLGMSNREFREMQMRAMWSDLSDDQYERLLGAAKDNSHLQALLSAVTFSHINKIDCLFETMMVLARQNKHFLKIATDTMHLLPSPALTFPRNMDGML